VFWRSAMSGGRATVMRQAGKKASAIAGDVTATKRIGMGFASAFFVECKFVKNLRFDGLVTGLKTGIMDYWTVAKREAKRHKKEPIIIAKQNNLPTIMVMSLEAVIKLQIRGSSDCSIAHYPKLGCCLVWFDGFLKEVEPYIPPRMLDLKLKTKSKPKLKLKMFKRKG